jgi:hypothetical protein
MLHECPCHYGMAHPQVADGRMAASLGVRHGANNPRSLLLHQVTKWAIKHGISVLSFSNKILFNNLLPRLSLYIYIYIDGTTGDHQCGF